MELWVLYLNDKASGVALGPTADAVLTQMRAASLGRKSNGVLSVLSWHTAPIEDVMRTGLGMLLQLTFTAQAAAQVGPRGIVQ